MATAFYLRDGFSRFHEYVDKHVQIKPSLCMATINSNYSGAERFVLYGDKIYHGIQYFTEDIELNSYYYGLHLLYPYWMSEADLKEMDMRYAEHYYFVHKQLLARYNLEMEQFAQINIHFYNDYENYFDPQLMFERKLPFRSRSLNTEDFVNNEQLKTIIRNVKENIANGVVFLVKNMLLQYFRNVFRSKM